MYIELGIRRENPFWKYLVGSAIVIVASTIGQIPLTVAVLLKAWNAGKPFPMTMPAMAAYLGNNQMLFWLLLSFAFALGALFLVVRYIHRQSILSLSTSRRSFDWRRAFFSFGLWALLTAVLTGIDYMTSPKDYVWNFHWPQFGILLVISVLMIPIQTSCEEYVFRGYLMQGFGRLAYNKWFPLVMTSLIFGCLHIFNPEVDKMGYGIMVYYIGTGLVMGVMTLMDEGIELSLGFHAANNMTGALLVTSDWSVLQTDSILRDVSQPNTGFEVMLPVLVVYPILLYIYSKKYRWTDWKGRLAGEIPRTDGADQPEL
jgi:membrane protease YdiL (CAAX protease family)